MSFELFASRGRVHAFDRLALQRFLLHGYAAREEKDQRHRREPWPDSIFHVTLLNLLSPPQPDFSEAAGEPVALAYLEQKR